jgi:hypothetical protein
MRQEPVAGEHDRWRQIARQPINTGMEGADFLQVLLELSPVQLVLLRLGHSLGCSRSGGRLDCPVTHSFARLLGASSIKNHWSRED